jgi:hypothetical protein
LLISAVIADPRSLPIPAVAKITAPTLETRPVLAAVPADPDALARSPRSYTGSQFIDNANDFVSGDAGIFNSWPPFFREHVTVAHTAGLNLDAHFSYTRVRNFPFDNLEIGSRLGNLRRLHWCYCDLCSCHDASFGIFNVNRSLDGSKYQALEA